MVSCKEKNSELKMIRGKQIEIGSDLKSDLEFLKEIQPYHDTLQGKINEVLCYNPRTLSRQESPLESSLAIFMRMLATWRSTQFSLKRKNAILILRYSIMEESEQLFQKEMLRWKIYLPSCPLKTNW